MEAGQDHNRSGGRHGKECSYNMQVSGMVHRLGAMALSQSAPWHGVSRVSAPWHGAPWCGASCMVPPGMVPRVWCPLAWCLVHGAPCMVPPVQVQGVQHGAPCAAWSRKWGMEGANLQNLGIAGRVHDGRCKCRQCRMVRDARGRAEEAIGCGGSQNGMAV